MKASAVGLALGWLLSATAWAQPAVTAEQPRNQTTSQETAEETPAEEPEGFVLPPTTQVAPPLVFMGYVDVGFADAEGNGTSYPRVDTRLPADYGVDTFAPMVNSRGDVASNDPGGLFVNGFLPRSAGIGGRPSFLLNTVNFDMRYLAPHAPIMVFARLQLMPRFGPGRGNQTGLVLDQGFARVTPITGKEFFVSVGKFDSVFGIEYLDNQANFRTGVTPSLLARYTTGTSLGAKVFFRQQIAPLWSAVSLNTSATNSGSFVEALQPPDASLTGIPVLSARLGYELNLRQVQVKLGASGMIGPRNDQRDQDAKQRMWGADARLYFAGLSLAGEYVHVDEDLGAVGKETGMGAFPVSSEFRARGYWVQGAYAWHAGLGPLTAATVYGRYERRRAEFEGFRPIAVARVTTGLRFDLWEALVLKVEVLFNEERRGAPRVDNDVFTCSVVYSW